MSSQTEIEHSPDFFLCYEFAPVSWEKDILPYMPQEAEWEEETIQVNADHGEAHAAECLMWGQILLPIIKERGVRHLDVSAVLLALGYHDVGRKQEDDDKNHPLRAVRKLVTGRLKQGKFTETPNESFTTALLLCRFHSQKPGYKDSNNMRLLHYIDILTMFGRYHKTKWVENLGVKNLLATTPLIEGRPVLSELETARFIEIEKKLHTEARRIADGNFLQAGLQAARQIGLLTA